MAGKSERPAHPHSSGAPVGQGAARRGILGDIKPVGNGVFEMREFFGPGWRMYYVERSGALIIMLGGGDKSSQASDIERARQLAKEWP